MAQVNKDTMIGELLQIDENIAPILLNIGMHCLGCPSSQMETIEQAASPKYPLYSVISIGNSLQIFSFSV